MKNAVVIMLLGIGLVAVTVTVNANPFPDEPEVTVTKSESILNDDGSFSYTLETSDGAKRMQSGRIKNPQEPDPEKRSQIFEGSYSFLDENGSAISITYVADENGYQPSGDSLPTAPPTPDHILKLLELINSTVRKQRAAAEVKAKAKADS